jgi:3-isopropylmalate/(R)-2-methylmalate dehydratase small subunit
MKRVSKTGLGEGLFADERYVSAAGREPNPTFVLNQAAYKDCSILIAGPNFGCGSSREHAVWALKEFGIRAIVAASFGAIFANNCIRNGLLPVTLPQQQVDELAARVMEAPQAHPVCIDLRAQTIRADDLRLDFDIDAGARHMLLHGLDAIALTQTRWELIQAFHEARREKRPWLYTE